MYRTDFFTNARKILEANEAAVLKETIFALLKTTRTFILERKPKGASSKDAEGIDYKGLANWYQELSLTWRRLRYFCQNNMVEKAYTDASYLQEEFFYIAQDYKVEELNLLDSFDKDNLSLLADRANQLEKIIKQPLKTMVLRLIPTALLKSSSGELIYIPESSQKKKGWGEKSGSRDFYIKRNAEIRSKHSEGKSIAVLADEFALSVDSIRRILYS